MDVFDKLSFIPAALRDIVDAEGITDKTLFLKYKKKADVAQKIYKELLNRFDVRRKGFIIDEAGREIGLLSQCQSLQSLLLLANSFGLDFDTPYDENKTYTDKDGEKRPLTIRIIMDMVIEDIISSLAPSVKGAEDLTKVDIDEVIFSATPYVSSAFDTEYAYIDCITWVIPTFLLVLQHHAMVRHEVCRFERQLIAIIKKGLDYMNEAYIPVNEQLNKERLTCGWNFTKDCEEPSLYFTFAVTECFVSFYTAFGKYAEDMTALSECDGPEGIPLTEEATERIEKNDKIYRSVMKKNPLLRVNYDGSDAAIFGVGNEYNELHRLFDAINDGQDRYTALERNCKEAASTVWELVKGKLADFFFYNDLHATITEEDIKMSTTNDALFNTVYIINTMLNAGVDLDLQKRETRARINLERAIAEGSSRVEECERKLLLATREYNNILEVCQLALQKAFRTYEVLKNESREYIVDQFLVGFNEKLVKLESKVRELRKLRIRVFSLVPLLIKTNSAISAFLVKYPQDSMKKYLGYIMDNRYCPTKSSKKEEKARWIWEKDGFFSASNYYYIYALGEFYDYYEAYESDFVDSAATISKQKSDIERLEEASRASEEERTEAIRAKDAELADKNAELADKDAEIERIRSGSAIEAAVRDMVQRELQSSLPRMLCEFLNQTSAAYMAPFTTADAPEPGDDVAAFRAAAANFILACCSGDIARHLKEFPQQSPAEAFACVSKVIKNDFDDVISFYIHSLFASHDGKHESPLLKLLDTDKSN